LLALISSKLGKVGLRIAPPGVHTGPEPWERRPWRRGRKPAICKKNELFEEKIKEK
jgi:hypothetical protein